MENTCAELVGELQKRKAYLETQLQIAQKQDEKLQLLPAHKIRVLKHGTGYQYYLRSDGKDTSGIYLRKDQENMVKQTMQKEYIQKMIPIMQKELADIKEYLKKDHQGLLVGCYDRLNEGRKRMIEPLEISDEEFVKQWLNVQYTGKSFSPDSPEYYTQKMERVRSKSEIIIANTLEKFQIPYRYEYPIYVKGMGTIYPDFTVLNVKKRKELYLEHFGMLDDIDYRNKTMQKLELYEMNGIYPGDQLIVTYESYSRPLNVKSLEKKIIHYLT